METKIDKLWQLFKQPSTHKGIIAIIGAIGIAINPANIAAIGAITTLAYGVYQIIRDEDKQIKSAK